VATALALAACGGGGGGDEDPMQVLEATFTNEQQIDSGVVDFSFDLTAEGDQPGETKVSLDGPFQRQDGQFAQFDMEAEVSFDADQGSFSGTGGLTSTGDRAFVNFQDTEYEVPQQSFQQFVQNFTRLQQQNEQQGQATGSQQLLDSFSDLTNEGSEEVDGTDTTHISGTLDVAKFKESVRAQIESAGAAAVPQSQLNQLNTALDQIDSAVQSATFDVYSGTDDDLLRKLDVNLDLTTPTSGDVTVDVSLTLSDVNQPQQISAPADAQPLDTLLQQLNVDPGSRGQRGGALAGASSGSSGPQAGGSPSAPSGSATDAYLECLQLASISVSIQECLSLI
jgi:hypothetical protein